MPLDMRKSEYINKHRQLTAFAVLVERLTGQSYTIPPLNLALFRRSPDLLLSALDKQLAQVMTDFADVFPEREFLRGERGQDGKHGRDGRDGEDGKDAVLPDIAAMVADEVAKIPVPNNGEDGVDGADAEITDEDIQTIIDTVYQAVLPHIPEAIQIHPQNIRDSLELLEGDERLAKTAIDGLDTLEEKVGEIAAHVGRVEADGKRGMFNGGGIGKSVVQSMINNSAADKWEKVAQNLESYPPTITRTSGKVTSIAYNTGSGTITKTINRTSNKVQSIVLSGDLPSDLTATTKTLTRDPVTTGKVVSWTYS